MIELMRAISELGFGWSAWAGRNDNVMLQGSITDSWARNNIYSEYKSSRGRVIGGILDEPFFASWVKNHSPAVVHRTYYPIRDMVGNKKPHVETLHDLWDERSNMHHDKGAIFRSFIKKRACQRADAVVCVSEHTRDEAIDRWPALAHKITVIPHGVRPLSLKPIAPNIDRPYFLFVGKRGQYKNFIMAAEALQRSGLDHAIVCFGGGPFSEIERRALSGLKIIDRVEQISGGDDQLAGLYTHATALLYPSSFEGFGLPLLEAMVHQCPVIASPLTSLPEVGGDAVIYADPRFPDSWEVALQRVVSDPILAKDLRLRGRCRSELFSWRRSAELHSKLYQTMA